MHSDIAQYHLRLTREELAICQLLHDTIELNLVGSESKVWHAHPVWFLNGNPIVGYSSQKKGLKLMFWSGRDFQEPLLIAGSGRFQDASVLYHAVTDVQVDLLEKWLKKAAVIQWDYKNIVKKRGKLEKLSPAELSINK